MSIDRAIEQQLDNVLSNLDLEIACIFEDVLSELLEIDELSELSDFILTEAIGEVIREKCAKMLKDT